MAKVVSSSDGKTKKVVKFGAKVYNNQLR